MHLIVSPLYLNLSDFKCLGQDCSVYFITDLSNSNDFDVLIVIVDYGLSKRVVLLGVFK